MGWVIQGYGVSILQQVQDERKLIRFMLMDAISRYRRPFPAYPAGNPIPLILNLLKDGRERAEHQSTYPKSPPAGRPIPLILNLLKGGRGKGA